MLLLFVLLLVALAYKFIFSGITKSRAKLIPRTQAEFFIDPPNKLNILLLGADERPKDGDPGRSDTLLLMTVDTVTRDISVLSIPRDTRVRMEGIGWDKINHAFSFGGVYLTQHVAEDFLGIRMDYYAKIDLYTFGRIVDAIGGVTIDVEKRMNYIDTWDHYVIDLMPGVQRLDGRTALQYVRYRDEEGDIGRVRRQQKFIRAVLNEIESPAIILKAPSLIREVTVSLDTNMSIPLMLGLVNRMKDGLRSGLKAEMVEGLPYYIDDISYWIPDILKTRRMVAAIQGVPFIGAIQEAAERTAADYRENFPGNAHLDDGSYYPGMDKAPVKPSVKPSEKPQGKPGAAPVQKPPSTSPAPTGNKSTK